MLTLRLAALALIAMLTTATFAQAEDPVRRENVHFAPGATEETISGNITGRETVLYSVGAQAGQTISISLLSASPSLYFNLYAPGHGPGDEALAIGEMQDPINTFTGPLPQSGTYTVSVFLYRNAARDGKNASYSLNIGITGAAGEVVTGDFADGLEGGPDFWAVATNGGGPVNVRSSASSGADLVAKIPAGTKLRNLGCRMAEGRRWCHVATLADPGDEGWVAGDYLVEGAGP